jgi:hypothetical protein
MYINAQGVCIVSGIETSKRFDFYFINVKEGKAALRNCPSLFRAPYFPWFIIIELEIKSQFIC